MTERYLVIPLASTEGPAIGHRWRSAKLVASSGEASQSAPAGDTLGLKVAVDPNMCENRTMSEEIDDRELGARVAEARALAALTQEELASRTRMERTVISKIENGARRLGATELVAIADALERPVDWFFKTSPPAVISRRADPSVGGRSRILDTKVERIARDIEFLRDQDETTQF